MIAAIIGCGTVGQRHDQNFRRLGYTVRTWDRDPARCTVGTWAQAFDGASLAVIATPPGSHVAYALAALKAGVPWVLVEKPLASSVEEAEGLREHRDAVRVGYCLRFAAATRALRDALPRLGAPQLIEAVYADRLADRPAWLTDPQEGGVLLEHSHILDLLLWLLGPIGEIQAECWGRPETAVVATLRWRHDTMGTLRMDFESAPETRLKVIGGGGVVEWQRDRITGAGGDEQIREEPGAWLWQEAQEVDALCRERITASDRLCSLEEGIAVLRLIERIREAGR